MRQKQVKIRARVLAEKVPQEVLERLLFVPMLRIDYEGPELRNHGTTEGRKTDSSAPQRGTCLRSSMESTGLQSRAEDRLNRFTPNSGEESKPKTYSVRVCEINYVRYVMMYDIPLPALRRLLFHSSWSIDQLLHVHNPFSAKICTLVPYRLFDEQRERIMAKLFDDEAGQALYARFLEVAAFPQLPNRYYFDFSDAEIDESERAWRELKGEKCTVKQIVRSEA